MHDVVMGFYVGTLRNLLAEGAISISDSVLIVCGGILDQRVAETVGFTNVTITNIDGSSQLQDAESLTYQNQSFDVVIVHAGLHHCYSPHRALFEMYRVARKMVIAFEARNSLTMRLAVRLGLTLEYETNAITPDGRGGVADTAIPNFIYRWTERDVRSSIASFDPMRRPDIRFFYDLRIPLQRLNDSGGLWLRTLAICVEPISHILARIAPSQCNEFAFAISKNGPEHPWIK